jgi:hypothetical protein
MLVWKNQNPWTALRGFFYDYYLDYTGGYFGYKHGAALVHIQLNLNDSVVCVLNQTTNRMAGLTAVTRLYDLHGKLVLEKEYPVGLNEQDVILLEKIALPKDENEIFFLKLELADRGRVLDENLYWLSNNPSSYEKMNKLEKISLKTALNMKGEGHAVIEISNQENETAFFIRLKVMNSKNELVLPSYFTENFFTLMPGDKKQVELDFVSAGMAGKQEGLKLVTEGWNINTEEIKF